MPAIIFRTPDAHRFLVLTQGVWRRRLRCSATARQKSKATKVGDEMKSLLSLVLLILPLVLMEAR